MQLSAVDLPQPDGPSRAMNSPRSDRQRHVAQRVAAWPKSRLDPVEPQLAEVARETIATRSAYLPSSRADLLVPALERIDQLAPAAAAAPDGTSAISLA